MSGKFAATRSAGLDKSHGAVMDSARVQPFPKKPTVQAPTQGNPLPVVALYDHIHFEGGTATTPFNWSYIGDWWTDKVASIAVLSGVWEFYSERDYKGDCWVLGPGLYDDVGVKLGSIRVRS
jgi:hypothetical protein